jgi:hypothetical protein
VARTLTATAVVALSIGCGSDPPASSSRPPADFWAVNVVLCGNCPGLTNAQFVTNDLPHRARLKAGDLTSVVIGLCAVDRPYRTPDGQVTRWIIGDPSVISIQPSGSGSATIAAMRTGVTTLRAEVVTPDGTVHQAPLIYTLDAVRRCEDYPPLVFEITP